MERYQSTGRQKKGTTKVLLRSERPLSQKRKTGGEREEGRRQGRAYAGQSRKHHAYGCCSASRWNRGSDIVERANTCAVGLRSLQFMIKVPCLHF